jgi:hypothetical protein
MSCVGGWEKHPNRQLDLHLSSLYNIDEAESAFAEPGVFGLMSHSQLLASVILQLV